jgi:uncharacterized protein YjiS (DUF1127 family)
MDLKIMLRRIRHARRVEKELEALSDRALNELGIFRVDIPAVAREDARRVVTDRDAS